MANAESAAASDRGSVSAPCPNIPSICRNFKEQTEVIMTSGDRRAVLQTTASYGLIKYCLGMLVKDM